MPEEPTEPPVNNGGNGSTGNPPLIDDLIVISHGMVPQALPEARKPPLRPHPKRSNGTQGNQAGGSKPEGQ